MPVVRLVGGRAEGWVDLEDQVNVDARVDLGLGPSVVDALPVGLVG